MPDELKRHTVKIQRIATYFIKNINEYDRKTVNRCIKGICIYNTAINEFTVNHTVTFEFIYIIYMLA